MSNSVRPHRWQPTRVPCPWDSPGKNTGVGCHFLLQCIKVKSESEVTQSCLTLSDPMDCRLLRPWDFPGKSTGVGCHCLLRSVSSQRMCVVYLWWLVCGMYASLWYVWCVGCVCEFVACVCDMWYVVCMCVSTLPSGVGDVRRT